MFKLPPVNRLLFTPEQSHGPVGASISALWPMKEVMT